MDIKYFLLYYLWFSDVTHVLCSEPMENTTVMKKESFINHHDQNNYKSYDIDTNVSPITSNDTLIIHG